MHHNNNKTLLSYLENNVSARGEQLAYIFLADGETEKGTLTYRQLNEKALAIAAHLQQLAKVGDRLLLCYEPGLDFICGFLGCLYAGMIAVPAYPLRSNRHAQRLFAMVENCMPALILGTKESLALMQTEALFASATYVLTVIHPPRFFGFFAIHVRFYRNTKRRHGEPWQCDCESPSHL